MKLTTVMLMVSSYCFIIRLIHADESSNSIIGSLNCSRYFLYKGSGFGCFNSFGPHNLSRC